MADSKADADKPSADAAQPSKTSSLDGEPVIVTNRNLLKDPAAAEAESGADQKDKPAAEAKLTKSTPMKLKPLQEPTAAPEAEAPEPTAESSAKKESKLAAATAEPNTKPTEVAAKPAEANDTTTAEKPEAEPAKDQPETTDSEATKPVDPAAEEAKAAEQAKHDATIQKLIDSKQFYLPINSVEKRKTKRFVVLGIILSLLLAFAWTDIALDAGLVQISGIKPVTHFFSN